MGVDAASSVVDTTGAVHGCGGLYVADASILPAVTATNLHLTCVMIGEKIAHGLLKNRAKRLISKGVDAVRGGVTGIPNRGAGARGPKPRL